MRIICDVSFLQNPLSAAQQNRYNRHIYNLGSLAQQLGHQVVIFNGQHPISELVEKFNPELYISKLSSVNQQLLDSNAKSVVLLDRDEKYLSFNPDLVVTFSDYTYSGEHINQLPAVAATLHINGKFDPAWQCDLVYIGNRTVEKERLFKEYLFPAFSKCVTRVYSSNPFLPWTKECLGLIEEEDKKTVYKSASRALHLPASHISSRPFEILAAGGNCLATHDDKLKEIFEDRITYIDNIVASSIIDEKKIKDNMRWIMMNHTYLQRWNEIYGRVV